MQETARAHRRIDATPPAGRRWTLEGLLPRPVALFVPDGATGPLDLLVHFHGAPPVAEYAAVAADPPCAVAAVHLGAGSAVYAEPFAKVDLYDHLLEAIGQRLDAPPKATYISGFSAGYGAVGAILGHGVQPAGVLLLDGMHTGYIPPNTPLAQDGCIDDAPLEVFADWARHALKGQGRFLFTHSEVFPGTYASTTECADWLVERLGLARRPVLRWGPLGMQQLSAVGALGDRSRLAIIGFAGNTAPDHMDHLHGLYRFLQILRSL